jgi:hypothetical protein
MIDKKDTLWLHFSLIAKLECHITEITGNSGLPARWGFDEALD